ncbi:MAG: hypothetical protein NVS4B13_00740 [Candidatus Elarobacter sp.]
MRSPSSSLLLAALIAGVLPGACGRHDAAHDGPAQAQRATKNPSTFPLYRDSTVVTVVPVASAQIAAAIRANDTKADLPPNYHGTKVIA